MLNREQMPEHKPAEDVRVFKPQRRHNRGRLAGLALIALLGLSHPPAVPGIHTPKPSTTACDIRPSMLWLQPLVKSASGGGGGAPQQTVQVQFEVAEARRTTVPDTSFIQASVNGTIARVAHAEWITAGLMSMLVIVPQSVNGPVRHWVQVSMAGSQCSQQVEVPAMPQWNVYVPACADASVVGGAPDTPDASAAPIDGADTEGFLQSLLPLAKLDRTSVLLPDTVVSSWGLASVLAHAGMAGAVRNTTPPLTQNPGLFWWEGPDGARVLMNVAVNDVTAQPDVAAIDPLVSRITHTAERYATLKQTGHYPADAFLLDCDGPNSGALLSDETTAWNSRYAYPHIAGNQDEFFAAMAARYGGQLDTLRGSFDTQWNARIAEQAAATQRSRANAVSRLDAHTLAALAITQGYTPSVGTSDAILENALYALAGQINTGPASPVMTTTAEPNPYVAVFNTLAWERSAPVTITVAGDEPLYLTDVGTGNTIYSQRIAPHTLLFIAPDVPALGYKVFRLEGPQPDAASIQAEAFSAGTDATSGTPILSSSRLTLTVDSATGGIAIFDRLTSRQWMSGTLDGRSMLGNQLLYSVNGALLHPANLAARVISTGPVAAQLQITAQFTQGSISQFTQTATLFNDLPFVWFENTINQKAEIAGCSASGCPLERLYFAYPTDLPAPEMRVDDIGGITNIGTDVLPGVRRDDYAAQTFANLSAGDLGVTLALPDSPFVELGGLRTQQGYRAQPVSGQLFALAYSTANPSQPGTLQWRFGWMPHALAFDPAQSVKFGWAQRAPLRTWRLPINQQGVLPGTSRSYGPIAAGNETSNAVIVSALKPADDGDGLILRLWNPTELSQTVSLDLGALGVHQLQVTDGLERPMSDVEPALNTRPITIAARGFLTLRLLRDALPNVPPIAVQSTSPLPTPTGLSATVPTATLEASPSPQPTDSPAVLATRSVVLPLSTATSTPLPPPSPTPETPIAQPTFAPETATSTSAPATAVPVVSATVVVVNAGNTPTVQATVAAPVAPPVAAPATAPPASTATATPPVTGGITATATSVATPALPATPTTTGTNGVTPPTTVPTTTAPNLRQLAVLDSFDRADGRVGSGWMGNTLRYAIRNNQLVSGTSGSDIYNVMYWGTPLGATQEVAVKFAAISVDTESPNWGNSAVRLMLKWTGTNISSVPCSAVRVTYDLSDSRVSVEYCDNEGFTWVAARNGIFNQVTFAAGDTFGAQIDAAGAVQVFKNGTLLGTANVGGASGWNFADSASGRVGLWYNDVPGVVLDDFAGK